MIKLWKKYSYLVLVTFLVIGLFDFRVGLAASICMVGPVALSFFRGRYWCGNICPRGSFYDNVLSKISSKRKTPRFLQSKYFRALFATGLLSFFVFGTVKNWENPYLIGFIFYRMIVITTLIGIVLSLAYNHRVWCSFCPMGSIAALISYFKKDTKTLKVSNSCVSCKICEKKCNMNIVPYNYKGNILNHPDCIQCGLCTDACPKNSISY